MFHLLVQKSLINIAMEIKSEALEKEKASALIVLAHEKLGDLDEVKNLRAKYNSEYPTFEGTLNELRNQIFH